ncbi:hypothetical protein BOTCAL_0388g00070 [Botryotinia calthae]|uniref:Uncharacterized protein n=1 Tax=Botryotinia calthae TaxID=38488 RepID=A0A4Y8CR21_9HELO|nr:hypothetical protein BOTCAL_0388g00070 [Botryotinia calthae]
MLDSESNRKENTPLEKHPKRILSECHQESTPPFKKHKGSESPPSTESSPGSVSKSSPKEQDVTVSFLLESPSRNEGVEAGISSESLPSKVVTFKSTLERGPSSQNHAEILEIKSILVTKQDTPAPPPSPRPRNAVLPLPSPRPGNAMLPPPRPDNAQVSRSKSTGKDKESMPLPASASLYLSRPFHPEPVKLHPKLKIGPKAVIDKSINQNIKEYPVDDEGIDMADDIHNFIDSDKKSDREEGLDEETGTSKLGTSTAPPITSSPMIRSSQINRKIMSKPSEAQSVPFKSIKMVRESNKSIRMEKNGIRFTEAPNHDDITTYRGVSLKAQIEAHKCELCIPHGWKIPYPRLEDPAVTGPLYRKVIHLRRGSDKIVTTAIEFTDAPGEDNIHAFIDRAESDAYNAGMPINLEPRVFAVRWSNEAQDRYPIYQSAYSIRYDPYVSVIDNSSGWRLMIQQMRKPFLSKQNWMIWWKEKDCEKDRETVIL